MNREESVKYQNIRLLNIECDQPYDWGAEDVTHIRVRMPVDAAHRSEMLCRGFTYVDRMLDVSVNLTRSKLDFAALVRMQPVLTSQRRDEIYEIARQSFPTDSRFHLNCTPNQEVADVVLRSWVNALSEYYLCEHRGEAVGFLALTGEGDRRFVHLAAVLERYRTTGAALSLYAAAARDCKAAGIRVLNGRISTSNPAVMNLYAFLGGNFSNPTDVYHKEM